MPRMDGSVLRERRGELPRHADNSPIARRMLKGRVGKGAVSGCGASTGLEARMVVADDGRGKFRREVAGAGWKGGRGGGGERCDQVPCPAECLVVFNRELGAAARSDLQGNQEGPVRLTESQHSFAC